MRGMDLLEEPDRKGNRRIFEISVTQFIDELNGHSFDRIQFSVNWKERYKYLLEMEDFKYNQQQNLL